MLLAIHMIGTCGARDGRAQRRGPQVLSDIMLANFLAATGRWSLATLYPVSWKSPGEQWLLPGFMVDLMVATGPRWRLRGR